MGKGKDLRGKRFGKLTVIEKTDKRVGTGYVVWKCKCDCGNTIETSLYRLNGKKPKRSCGCDTHERRAESKITHGDSRTRLYRTYMTMRTRCENPNAHAYCNYGGRGVSVCEEWKTFEPFREWALANGYDETAKRGKCTLDRIDTNKGYSPDNCRWVNMKTQQNNRRNNIKVCYGGKTRPLTEWAEIVGVQYGTLQHRYKRGWTPKEILFGK